METLPTTGRRGRAADRRQQAQALTREQQEAHWAALLAEGSVAASGATATTATAGAQETDGEEAGAAYYKGPVSSKELKADVEGMLQRFLGREIPKLGGQVRRRAAAVPTLWQPAPCPPAAHPLLPLACR